MYIYTYRTAIARTPAAVTGESLFTLELFLQSSSYTAPTVPGRWGGRRGNSGPSFTTPHAVASGTR